jgi:DNA-directed RNA polymerase subunit RPC12/RpoP
MHTFQLLWLGMIGSRWPKVYPLTNRTGAYSSTTESPPSILPPVNPQCDQPLGGLKFQAFKPFETRPPSVKFSPSFQVIALHTLFSIGYKKSVTCCRALTLTQALLTGKEDTFGNCLQAYVNLSELFRPFEQPESSEVATTVSHNKNCTTKSNITQHNQTSSIQQFYTSEPSSCTTQASPARYQDIHCLASTDRAPDSAAPRSWAGFPNYSSKGFALATPPAPLHSLFNDQLGIQAFPPPSSREAQSILQEQDSCQLQKHRTPSVTGTAFLLPANSTSNLEQDANTSLIPASRYNIFTYRCETCGKSFAKKEYIRYKSPGLDFVILFMSQAIRRLLVVVTDLIIPCLILPSPISDISYPFLRFIPYLLFLPFYLEQALTLLRKHKTRNHAKKRFPCPEKDCDFLEAELVGLKKHINSVHTREVMYPCKKCGTEFAREDHLKRHEKSNRKHQGWKR